MGDDQIEPLWKTCSAGLLNLWVVWILKHSADWIDIASISLRGKFGLQGFDHAFGRVDCGQRSKIWCNQQREKTGSATNFKDIEI